MKKQLLFSLLLLPVAMYTLLSFAPVPQRLSPMSKLMRGLLHFIQTEKQRIATGGAKQAIPRKFRQVKTARVTPGKHFAEDHETYVASFLTALGNYENATDLAARKQSFNLIINSCIACHREECPGPIATIKENLVDE